MKYIFLFFLFTSCNKVTLLDLIRIPSKKLYNMDVSLVLACIESEPRFYQINPDSISPSLKSKFIKLNENFIFQPQNELKDKNKTNKRQYNIIVFEVHPISYYYTKKALESGSSHSAGFMFYDSTYSKYFYNDEHLLHKNIYFIGSNSSEFKKLTKAFKKRKLIMFEHESVNNSNLSYDSEWVYESYVTFNWYEVGKIDFNKLFTDEQYVSLTLEKLENFKRHYLLNKE